MKINILIGWLTFACLLLIFPVFRLIWMKKQAIQYTIQDHKIIVDGFSDDWDSIPGEFVHTKDKLWIGQGMVTENWKGPDDLNFRWKASHYNNKVYFLFKVTDNVFVEPAIQSNSF